MHRTHVGLSETERLLKIGKNLFAATRLGAPRTRLAGWVTRDQVCARLCAAARHADQIGMAPEALISRQGRDALALVLSAVEPAATLTLGPPLSPEWLSAVLAAERHWLRTRSR